MLAIGRRPCDAIATSAGEQHLRADGDEAGGATARDGRGVPGRDLAPTTASPAGRRPRAARASRRPSPRRRRAGRDLEAELPPIAHAPPDHEHRGSSSATNTRRRGR